MITTEVFCTFQIEGTHNWPDCPYDEVDYLCFPHRHMFHIKAYKKVNHDDRDVEFIMLKHSISAFMYNHFDDPDEAFARSTPSVIAFGAMSCEMIARDLIEKFDLSRCEVSEDGENGAILTVENEYE